MFKLNQVINPERKSWRFYKRKSSFCLNRVSRWNEICQITVNNIILISHFSKYILNGDGWQIYKKKNLQKKLKT
jgi:hypothetical protein